MLSKMGYRKDDKLLIVNADDFGMCHSGNAAIVQLLEEKAISSATVMMPCSWAVEAAQAAAGHPDFDVGIHLTLTSEWNGYRWGPVTRGADVSTLVTEDGYFPHTCEAVEERADGEQVRTELRNQVLLGRRLGIDPTHLDNHMGSIYGLKRGRDFLRETIDLCEEFRLPLRLPRTIGADREAKLPPGMMDAYKERIAYADSRGITLIDHLFGLPYSLREGETYETFKAEMSRLLRGLPAGISEIIIHPFFATDEVKAITGQWAKRQMEFELFRDPDIRRVIREENIIMIDWRLLREAQRNQ